MQDIVLHHNNWLAYRYLVVYFEKAAKIKIVEIFDRSKLKGYLDAEPGSKAGKCFQGRGFRIWKRFLMQMSFDMFLTFDRNLTRPGIDPKNLYENSIPWQKNLVKISIFLYFDHAIITGMTRYYNLCFCLFIFYVLFFILLLFRYDRAAKVWRDEKQHEVSNQQRKS